MLTPLVWRDESSPHESKGWVAWIDGLYMPHAFIWAKKLLTSPIAGGWESEVNTLNLRFRAGSGTAESAGCVRFDTAPLSCPDSLFLERRARS